MTAPALTPDAIRAMPAGRELDVLVAEHVLGFMVEYVKSEPCEARDDPSAPLGFATNFSGAQYTADREWLVDDWWHPDTFRRVADYSSDIAAVWAIVDQMASQGRGLVLEDWRNSDGASGAWAAYFDLPGGHTSEQAVGDTAQHAICRAALLLPSHTEC